MNTLHKIVLSALIAGAIVGGYFFPKFVQVAGNSAAGTTASTQKMASIIWTPSAITSTSTSILNTDDNDRIIQQITYSCNSLSSVFNSGTVLPSGGYVFRAATTSANTGIATTLGNPNLVLNTSVATSTTFDYAGSTTPGQTGTVPNRIWASASYLTFTASATSTGNCIASVQYLVN